MATATLFSSTQACPRVLNLVLDLQLRPGIRLVSIRQLPSPRRARVASLRLELASLQQDERIIRWVLSQYAEYRRLPDACLENGLRADLDATCSRLRAVKETLQALATLDLPV